MDTVKALVPSYYDKFFCIGHECEANCCLADWKIFIDKNTYNLYRNIKDPDFQAKLPERIKRVKGEKASDKNYAQFILDENGGCKFLEDGICSIQAKYGFKHLSVTCLVFPRKQLLHFGGNLESALSVTCPEVIRVGLFPKEKMTFKTISMQKTHNKSLAALPASRFNEKQNALGVHAPLIRQCCIEIMQERQMSVADRIFTIGMMLKKLREISDVGKFDQESVLQVVQTYVVSAKNGQFNNLLSTFSDNEETRADMQAMLFNTAISFDPEKQKRNFPSFIPCVEKFAEDQGKKPDELTYLDMSQMIDKAAEDYWKNFLDERSHILENYFVNYIFANTFPFGMPLGIQHQVLILAESYALFRMLLCGPAALEGGITDDGVIKAVMDIFKHTSHSKMLENVTGNYLLTMRDSLAHVSFLLRE